MTRRRDFLKRAGAATAGAVAATTLGAPYVKAQSTIKWRLQTYAGPALAAWHRPFLGREHKSGARPDVRSLAQRRPEGNGALVVRLGPFGTTRSC